MNIKLDIPEKFFQGEELCGYYVTPEMKKVWAVQLDLINEFDRVCKKYNIQWWIDAGTLLGAVRHKGFIPWDDDVDVIMMRSEYEKFLKIPDEEFQAPYKLSTRKNDGQGRLIFFAKLSNEDTTLIESDIMYHLKRGAKNVTYSNGIYVDIFPLDNVPDDDIEAEKFFTKAKHLRQKAEYIVDYTYHYYTNHYYPDKKLWKRFIKALIHYACIVMRVSSYDCLDKFLDFVKLYESKNTKRIAKMISITDPKFHERRIWNRSDFNNTIYMPFEMLNLPVPSGYINILDKFYGNWHEFYIRGLHGCFYDTENSYKNYINGGRLINENLA